MTPLEQLGDLARIPLEVEAVLDQRILTIGEILQLEPGSVIKLERSAGENIDVHVGGAHIGYGEALAMEDMLCVMITDFRDRE